MPTIDAQEECKLVAVDTGDGWSLEVHAPWGEVIAFLAWPKSWPETMTNIMLEAAGFEIA